MENHFICVKTHSWFREAVGILVAEICVVLECILWQLLEDDGVRESRVEDKNKVPAIYVNNKRD